MDSPVADLLSLSEAAALLRKVHRPRGIQTLRDRIKRGTLRGIRRGRYWYVYRADIERLANLPYHPEGGRPRSVTTSSSAYAEGTLTVDVDEVLRLGTLTIEKRISAMLGGQAFLIGIRQARLKRRYPRLGARDLVLKMFEELWDGEYFPRPDVLRRNRSRPR